MHLTVTSYINCIVARWPDKRFLSHSMYLISSSWRCTFCTTSFMTLNYIKINNYDIIASFKSESVVKLMNRIPSCVFWYQVHQAWLWERMLNHLASLAMSTSVLKVLPGKLDIKRHSPSILYISASLAMLTSVLKTLPDKLDIKIHSPSILYEGGSICNKNPFITLSTNALGSYAICQTKYQSVAVKMVHETLFYLSKFNKLYTF